jgi:hypothetical protein
MAKSSEINNFGYGVSNSLKWGFIFLILACFVGISYFTIGKPFSKLNPVSKHTFNITLDEYDTKDNAKIKAQIRKQINDPNAIITISLEENFTIIQGPITLTITIQTNKKLNNISTKVIKNSIKQATQTASPPSSQTTVSSGNAAPTDAPTAAQTAAPTAAQTAAPTAAQTAAPTAAPTAAQPTVSGESFRGIIENQSLLSSAN